MYGDLRVAHVTFQKERLAADHTVHQEVVFDKIQDLVWHVQRGGDALISGSVCDALWKRRNKCLIFIPYLPVLTLDIKTTCGWTTLS